MIKFVAGKYQIDKTRFNRDNSKLAKEVAMLPSQIWKARDKGRQAAERRRVKVWRCTSKQCGAVYDVLPGKLYAHRYCTVENCGHVLKVGYTYD